MSKILVIVGSPRKNGNTELLADAFIDGVKVKHEITKIHIADLNISGCLGCDYCYEHHGICVQKDDMHKVYPKLKEMDVIVFATPVYYMGFSAQIKTFIDRLHAFDLIGYHIKSAVLLATAGSPLDSPDFKAIVTNYLAITNYLKWENKGIVLGEKVYAKGEILGSSALEKAKQLGGEI